MLNCVAGHMMYQWAQNVSHCVSVHRVNGAKLC
jgi:hypothetical protein